MARRSKGGGALQPIDWGVPIRWWFKRAGTPLGGVVHMLEVSPSREPLPTGAGSLCGTVGERELGYPWDEWEPGDRFCPECQQLNAEAAFREHQAEVIRRSEEMKRAEGSRSS